MLRLRGTGRGCLDEWEREGIARLEASLSTAEWSRRVREECTKHKEAGLEAEVWAAVAQRDEHREREKTYAYVSTGLADWTLRSDAATLQGQTLRSEH